jgi:hypothetical protein
MGNIGFFEVRVDDFHRAQKSMSYPEFLKFMFDYDKGALRAPLS